MNEERPTPGLDVGRRRSPDGCRLTLSGTIDADLKPDALSTGGAQTVVIDLDGVRRITSFGVREWISALKSAGTDDVYFVNVRPPLVSQFNMVTGFDGGGQLVSFYLPYVCETCDHEHDVFRSLLDEYDALKSGEPPPRPCPACGEESVLDDVAATYLSYARAQPAPRLSAAARRLLNDAPSDEPRDLRVQKEIDGDITAMWLSGGIDGKARMKRLLDGLEGTALLILAGVTQIDDKGAARVSQLLHLEGVDPLIARAPVQVLQALARVDEDGVRGRVVTALLSGSCDSCATDVLEELDLDELDAVADGERRECPACSGALTLSVADDEVSFVRGLCTPLPKAVRSYLGGHHGTELSASGATVNELRRHSSSATPVDDDDKYEVTRLLGVGGMAQVFLARQRGPGGFVKRVALKRILPTVAQNPHFVEMFLREARLAATVSHANVVQIFDLGFDGSSYFIAMEYVDGWDLSRVLHATRRLGRAFPVEIACRIVADICAGLHAAHTAVDDEGRPLGLVHRDVSPHNALVSAAGTVKVTDFGVSKAQEGQEQTRSGMVKGKLPYMSPEQIDRDLGALDGRADIFAAGVVLYELLTHSSPFKRDSDYGTMQAVLKADAPEVTTLRPDVPRAVSAIVARALQRSTADRYKTAQEMSDALLTALAALDAPSNSTALAHFTNELMAAAAQLGGGTDPSDTSTGETSERTPTSSLRPQSEGDVAPTQIISPDTVKKQG